MFCKFLIVFVATVFCLGNSLAAEHGGSGAAEGGKEESKAEGGKEGETPKEEKKGPKLVDEDAYPVVSARVQTLAAKIKSAEEEIKKLIEEKHHAKNQAEVSEIVKKMTMLHKQMQVTEKDYRQQKALLQFRYPEKEKAEQREYERIEVKPLGEMESQMGISSSVEKTLKRARIQYGSSLKENQNVDQNETARKNKNSGSGLVDPTIMKK